jgi:hypothetical protein
VGEIMFKIPSKSIVKQKLNTALEKLMYRDAYLLKNDLNERSITHKLALYLENEFENWDVDCEYNRDARRKVHPAKNLEKRLKNTKKSDVLEISVYPDIIVHHRGTDENLLIIEVKKDSIANDGEYDIMKLREYRAQLGYRYAAYIELCTGKKYGFRKPMFIEIQ